MADVTLSIIIPAYNASQYLDACICSVMMSTYKGFEVLLVDDGSTDGTGRLCDQLAEKYPVIKVFHTENRGLSSARNLGIEQASGKYIGFVDADDYVSSNMFEMLVSAIEEADADMAVCGYRRCQRSELRSAPGGSSVFTTITQRADIAQRILRSGYGCYVWNKLYQKSILDQQNITFRIDCGIAEDQYFTMEYLQYCGKAVFIEDNLYCYVMNETSLMNSFRNNRVVGDKYLGLPRAWRYTADAVKDISEDLAIYAQSRAAMFYQTVLRKLEKPGPEYIDETIAYVKEYGAILRRYRWGWKYYFSAVVLGISYPLWAAIFRRGVGKRQQMESRT